MRVYGRGAVSLNGLSAEYNLVVMYLLEKYSVFGRPVRPIQCPAMVQWHNVLVGLKSNSPAKVQTRND